MKFEILHEVSDTSEVRIAKMRRMAKAARRLFWAGLAVIALMLLAPWIMG